MLASPSKQPPMKKQNKMFLKSLIFSPKMNHVIIPLMERNLPETQNAYFKVIDKTKIIMKDFNIPLSVFKNQ